jgi:hypothetical protein
MDGAVVRGRLDGLWCVGGVIDQFHARPAGGVCLAGPRAGTGYKKPTQHPDARARAGKRASMVDTCSPAGTGTSGPPA